MPFGEVQIFTEFMSQVLRLENIFCIGKTDFFAILGSFLPLSFFDFFFFFSFLFYPVLWEENLQKGGLMSITSRILVVHSDMLQSYIATQHEIRV